MRRLQATPGWPVAPELWLTNAPGTLSGASFSYIVRFHCSCMQAPPGVGAFEMSTELMTPSPVARGCSAMLLLTPEAETDCTSPSREELGGATL